MIADYTQAIPDHERSEHEVSELNESEQFMYELAGARRPMPKPRSVISLGRQVDPDADLRDLDALLVEHGLPVPLNPESELLPECHMLDEAPTSEALSEESNQADPELNLRPLDWVDDLLESVAVGSGTLPYHAYQAHRRILKTFDYARVLSSGMSRLTWSRDDVIEVGKKSIVPIDNSSSSTTAITNKEKKERARQVNLPLRKHIPERQLIPTKWNALPRWKGLGAEAKQTPELRELVFGMRLTSLLDPEEHDAASCWVNGVLPEDVGFLSVQMPPEAADRFLRGVEGSPATYLRRHFLRALASICGDVEAVALWTRNSNNPGEVTLFLALRMRCRTTINDSIEAAEGRRVVRILESQGVRVGADMPSIERYCEERAGVSSYDLKEDDTHPGVREATLELDEWNVAGYVSRTGAGTRQDFEHRASHGERMWLNRMHAMRLPAWFSDSVVDCIRDYFLRGKVHAREKAAIVAKLREHRASATDRARLTQLDCMDPPLTRIRFYKASPAQFARVAAASGEIIDGCCDNRHKAGMAQKLYERMRSGIDAGE